MTVQKSKTIVLPEPLRNQTLNLMNKVRVFEGTVHSLTAPYVQLNVEKRNQYICSLTQALKTIVHVAEEIELQKSAFAMSLALDIGACGNMKPLENRIMGWVVNKIEPGPDAPKTMTGVLGKLCDQTMEALTRESEKTLLLKSGFFNITSTILGFNVKPRSSDKTQTLAL